MKTTENHPFQVGDVLYCSWGWEQTNIDFYQVVSATAKTIKVKKLKAVTLYNASAMTGLTQAVRDKFENDEILTRKPYNYGEWAIKIEYYSHATLWNGEPKAYSTYA